MNAESNRNCWEDVGTAGDGSCAKLAEKIHCRNCPEYSAGGRALLDQAAPPGYLEEWTAQLAREKEAPATDTVSMVVFRLRGRRFAVRTAALAKATAARPIRRVPHRTNDVFLGLANVDGELLLCADAGRLLAPEEPPGTEPRFMVVLRTERGERWALPVDAVEGLVRAPDSAGDRLETESGPVARVNETILFKTLEQFLIP